jgi:hypothetical protein
MAVIGKFRQEDFSVYYFVKEVLGSRVVKVIDSYPYNDVSNHTLTVPCASVEHTQTLDRGGELGSSWFTRTWVIDVFGKNDAQRDELADVLYEALDHDIPIRDYSGGFRDDGKSIAGADLRIIEYASVRNRSMRPAYAFSSLSEDKFWRTTITFDTVTTHST